ncbi:hypothetical protein B0A55_00470 [Friedmanniomyces simplex]|uniref:Uncharacterized protein n=1 Tax=Friedmanniomyces simplex TaxID=329884 RepID=A0A4U0Y514_9PEZI|nr:hypothetical protein B0A55_00470 [Friedmanniomyces simplex]
MSAVATPPDTLAAPDKAQRETTSLAKAKNAIQYMVDPKSGAQPTRLRTRAFLRSVRYILIFAFWRLVRYAKYAAVGAAVAAISGTAIGSIFSGAAFLIAPTGILGGAGVGVLWAIGKFGWRRATARVRRGGHEHAEHVDPRQDEKADAEGLKHEEIRAPRADPW